MDGNAGWRRRGEKRLLLLDEEKEQHETRAHLPLREPPSLCLWPRAAPTEPWRPTLLLVAVVMVMGFLRF